MPVRVTHGRYSCQRGVEIGHKLLRAAPVDVDLGLGEIALEVLHQFFLLGRVAGRILQLHRHVQHPPPLQVELGEQAAQDHLEVEVFQLIAEEKERRGSQRTLRARGQQVLVVVGDARQVIQVIVLGQHHGERVGAGPVEMEHCRLLGADRRVEVEMRPAGARLHRRAPVYGERADGLGAQAFAQGQFHEGVGVCGDIERQVQLGQHGKEIALEDLAAQRGPIQRGKHGLQRLAAIVGGGGQAQAVLEAGHGQALHGHAQAAVVGRADELGDARQIDRAFKRIVELRAQLPGQFLRCGEQTGGCARSQERRAFAGRDVAEQRAPEAVGLVAQHLAAAAKQPPIVEPHEDDRRRGVGSFAGEQRRTRLVGSQVDGTVLQQRTVERSREGTARGNLDLRLHGQHGRHAGAHQGRRHAAEDIGRRPRGALAGRQKDEAQARIQFVGAAGQQACGQFRDLRVLDGRGVILFVGKNQETVTAGLVKGAVGHEVQDVRTTAQFRLQRGQAPGFALRHAHAMLPCGGHFPVGRQRGKERHLDVEPLHSRQQRVDFGHGIDGRHAQRRQVIGRGNRRQHLDRPLQDGAARTPRAGQVA